MADRPQNNTFVTSNVPITALPVASLMQSRKNSIVNEPKTNWRARFNLKVPMNINQSEKAPHKEKGRA